MPASRVAATGRRACPPRLRSPTAPICPAMASLADEDGDMLADGCRAPRPTFHQEVSSADELPHLGLDFDLDELDRRLEAPVDSFEADRAALRAGLQRGLQDGSLEEWLRVDDLGPQAFPGERTVPGASMPSKTPPPLPEAAPPCAFVVEGTLVEDLCEVPCEEDQSASRRARAPKPTMCFQEPVVNASNPELRKLGEEANSLPLEGELGELATQLKRELLSMNEKELADGYSDLPLPQGEEVVTERLIGKLGDGAPLAKLQVGGRTPDFAGYSRLSPLVLESLSSRLGSLTKDEIRSENQTLRDEIGHLRSEVKCRHEELRRAGRIPGANGT